MTDSDFLTMNRINATRRFKYTLQSHAPSAISVSHTMLSMQNPVGSQSNFGLGDREPSSGCKKKSGEMMSPMYVRYCTAPWDEGLEEAIRVLNVGWGREGLRWFD